MPRKTPTAPSARATLTAIADNGSATSTVQAGDALVIRAGGLRPATPYAVTLRDAAGEIATQSFLSDRKGAIGDAVLWSYLGIDDPREREAVPVEKARARWLGRTLDIALHEQGKKAVATTTVAVAKKAQPMAIATDDRGHLRNGFERGTQDAILSLLMFPEGQTLRIWMVPRQHEWRPGDRIRPTQLGTERLAVADIRVAGPAQRVIVAKAPELHPGAFDFIIRTTRYGYEDQDQLLLQVTDVLAGRWATGLVIREEFMRSKVIKGGCTNLQDIACRRTLGNVWPYVQFTDTFQVGEDVWGTLDPNALDPAHVGKAAALYLVPHKTATAWTADNSLSHLAILGGNPNTQQWVTQSWCANANLHLLWPGATQVGEYDVVVDFGNNAPTLAGFTPDDQYNMPLDIIDGYIAPGFRIVPDPAVATITPHAGALSYTQPAVTVTNDFGGTVAVPLIANVRFPADVAGATTPAQISTLQPNYPVVVCVHGNSGHTNSYEGYDYLLDHLARNGFIAVSIHMVQGQTGTDRARILQHHLPIIFSMFGTHAANNIGIMGHSRGGEAVVIATRLNTQETWGWNINAVISLAPTNQYTFEHFSGSWARPYLVLYGSLDGDLGGISDNGFELYDHASDMNKSMAFVYRACHDRFNTVWGDGDFFFGQLTTADQAAVLSATSHQLIAKGYMNAFFRQHLQGEPQWAGIFRGEWIPAAAAASDAALKIYTQYEDTTATTIDDFEGPHTATSWQASTIGGSVAHVGLPTAPQEDDLRTMDPQSPHLTAGLRVRWDNTTDELTYTIPPGQRDVSAFQAVSFRITQRVNSLANPANQPQDLRLTLTDGAGHARAIRISKLTDIPYPHVRGVASLVKSAMRTIRIPLAAYHIHCLNVDQVDLKDITTLAFQFAETATGEIEIDSIQFTN